MEERENGGQRPVLDWLDRTVLDVEPCRLRDSRALRDESIMLTN